MSVSVCLCACVCACPETVSAVLEFLFVAIVILQSFYMYGCVICDTVHMCMNTQSMDILL